MGTREKCMIWGIGNDYEAILNQVHFEILKGNIEVTGVVCRKEDRYCKYRDGFPIILKEELAEADFEYVIVSSTSCYQEIKAEAVSLGIGLNKIINGQVFRKPLFDFGLYSELLKHPVTIITDDCWGGNVYHYLGLEFSSPLINTFCDRSEYAKLIQDPLFYLQTELTMVREGNLKAGIWPVGRLGDSEKYVQIQFVHHTDFNEAAQQWNRRKQRINQDNLFVKMGAGISDENLMFYLNIFDKCKYRKILFYNGDENIKGQLKTERFIWQAQKANCVDAYLYRDYMRNNYMFVVDILKLLTGAENYLRE